MPVPSATRYSVYSDMGTRTPIPSYLPYQKSTEIDDYASYRPPSGYKPVSPTRHNHLTQHHPHFITPGQYDEHDYNDALMGGLDMMQSLPALGRSQTVAPSYERQLRMSTPHVRSQSQNWADNGEFVIDDSAGIASTNLYRKSYSLPMSRSGRNGGQWRHIKQALGQTGSNILFIEGTVKDDDVRRYPPFGILEPEMRYNHLGQRMLPRRLGDTGGSAGNRRNQFSNRAKAGFQYWYKEPTSNISRRNAGPIGGAKFAALPKLAVKRAVKTAPPRKSVPGSL